MLQKIKKTPFLFFLLLLTGCGSSNNAEKGTEERPQAKKPHAKNYGELLLVAGSTNLSLFKGDIEKSCTDVVVNAANPWLADGGGVAGAIYDGAGKENIDKEIMRAFSEKLKGATPRMNTGEDLKLLKTTETYTSDAHDLKTKYETSRIIHALSPDFNRLVGKYEEGYTQLRITYKNIFKAMALENQESGYKSISIPPLSALNFAGSADKARIYDIMFEEIKEASDEYPQLQIMTCLRGDDVWETGKQYFKQAFQKKVMFVSPSKLSLLSYKLSELKLAVCEKKESLKNNTFCFSNHVLVEPQTKGLELFGGTKVKNSVIGLGVESMCEQSAQTHTTFKLSAITPVLSSTCGVSIGYMNLYLLLHSEGARKLARSFALNENDMSWEGFTGEIFTRYVKSLGDVEISSSFGMKALFDEESILKGFYFGLNVKTSSGYVEFSCTNTAATIGFNYHQ